MPRQKLTKSQLAAKKRVGAANFIPPTDYRSEHHKAKQTGDSAVAKNRAKQQFTPIYNQLHPSTARLVDQILDPEDVNDCVRYPNHLGLSGLFKAKNVINAKIDANGRSSIAVYPRMANCIFSTAGVEDGPTDFPIDSNPGPNAPPCPIAQDLLDLKANRPIDLASPIIFYNNHAIMAKPASSINRLVYPISIEVTAGGANLSVLGCFGLSIPAGLIAVSIVLYDANYATLSTSIGENVNDGTLAFNIPAIAGSAWMSIRIQSKMDLSTPFTLCMQSSTNVGAQPQYTLLNESQHMIVQDIKDSGTFYSSANKYTVVSQSALLTAQMSSTKDGGSLALARLPSNSFVGQHDGDTETFDNWYEYIASLAYNSYCSSTKEGGYGFYLGEDDRSYFYRDVNSSFDYHMPCLVSEFTVADQTEASIVRIIVTTICQYTSNSSIFNMAPSDYIPDWQKAIYLLSMVPAAYGNSTHKRELKKHLKAIAHKLVEVLKNPNTYKTAAKVGATLASIV